MRAKLLRYKSLVFVMLILIVGFIPTSTTTYSGTARNLNEGKSLPTIGLLVEPEVEKETLPKPEVKPAPKPEPRPAVVYTSSISLVKRYAEKHGVSWRLMEAIIRHETGNRTSRGFIYRHNSCGMMGRNGLMTFPSEAAGVEACARNIRTRYIDRGMTTLEAMQPVYAPGNPAWVGKVRHFYNRI